jgi:SSS family solute:Na+ symporter
MGLPLFLKEFLPIGITGVVIAAYFSAIMSTADSCLIASSGNLVNDIIQKHFLPNVADKVIIRVSQVVTLVLGVIAVTLAIQFTTVLDAILYAYAFMVSGLFVPTLGALFWKRHTSAGAFWAILCGGGTTLLLQSKLIRLPQFVERIGFSMSLYGILVSLLVFVTVSLVTQPNRK